MSYPPVQVERSEAKRSGAELSGTCTGMAANFARFFYNFKYSFMDNNQIFPKTFSSSLKAKKTSNLFSASSTNRA